jgi:uncharacterized protein
MKYFLPLFTLLIIFLFTFNALSKIKNLQDGKIIKNILETTSAVPLASPIPLGIDYMRSQNYPGSEIKVEKILQDGSNYKRYIVSYYSDNLKEYAYMTVPVSKKPSSGFPVIIFNHGYQIPELYTPDGNYISYMDALAKAGYIVFKPDFRGNGKSQGQPGSSYFSPNYAIDILNAIA